MPFYGKRRMRTVAVKRPASARKYTPRRKNNSKKPQVSFAKKVNEIIARNNENKVTQSLNYIAPVNTITNTYNISGNTNTYSAFTWSPGSTIFTIAQGTNVQQRIGNKIKLKRWIIKGIVEPNPTFTVVPPGYTYTLSPPYTTEVTSLSGIAINSLLGYVDIYFGKLMDNQYPIPASLSYFYQNGSTAVNSTYVSSEKLFAVNKDVYKIYYHRRVRLGANSVVDLQSSPQTQATFAQANGFSTTRSFGFDVCKYICKNKIIHFDDNDNTPQSADLQNLTLFAIFHPAAGNMTPTAAAAAAPAPNLQPVAFSPTTNNCYYNVNAMSYAEYEDA